MIVRHLKDGSISPNKEKPIQIILRSIVVSHRKDASGRRWQNKVLLKSGDHGFDNQDNTMSQKSLIVLRILIKMA